MSRNTSIGSYYKYIIEQKPLGYTFNTNPYFKGFEFEKVNLLWWQNYGIENWHLAFYVGAVYILAIFGIQRLMKNRPAFELKYPLFMWNLTIGLLTIIGFIRVLPGFLRVINEQNGLYNSICLRSGLDIPTAYWTVAFTLSKFVELGDTIFIVLRKRPLVFLQWYHHLTALIVTWLTAPLAEPAVRFCAVLNIGVHSLMYPYFALKAIGVKVPTYIANIITTLQLGQMLVGLAVNVTSWYLQYTGYNCPRHPLSIKVFCFVYGSFILMFGKLFYDLVIKSKWKLKDDKRKQS
ncbi:unnamed protein product [Orchesella dallaii]|uniref:Elongation of very long chain fatty acids protein n=1 Tax=Orchesella dallaii TaxID=48710 RepID=A0ABP1Q8S0_9HEXA